MLLQFVKFSRHKIKFQSLKYVWQLNTGRNILDRSLHFLHGVQKKWPTVCCFT